MLKALEKRKLREIAKKWAVQGYHHHANIEQYFKIMIQAAKAEFTEDNAYTLGDFLEERFAVAMAEECLPRPSTVDGAGK